MRLNLGKREKINSKRRSITRGAIIILSVIVLLPSAFFSCRNRKYFYAWLYFLQYYMNYALNIGDVAKAEKLRKKLEEAGDKGGAMDNYGFRPS